MSLSAGFFGGIWALFSLPAHCRHFNNQQTLRLLLPAQIKQHPLLFAPAAKFACPLK
jgi:hypothetical protein